ncbi:MAG: isochorismatase family protein [Chitinivibrionales bacterium]|nr:isochorismatase family protein [Chitinivibrionales bacterium]
MKSAGIQFDKQHSALLVVDMQPDFIPGGPLGVPTGDQILSPVRTIMESERFGVIAATQDWHPSGHISFASHHEGKKPLETIQLYGKEQILWPDHCVQGTAGAMMHPDLPWDRVLAFVRKGEDPGVDSYSGFRNNRAPDGSRPKTGLAGYFHDRSITTIFVCGLARDVCVRWTAEDAADEGFTTILLWNLSRSVNPDGDDQLRKELAGKNVKIAESSALGL